MKEVRQKQRPNVMAFYNPNGFVPAYKHVKAFAGDDGHVATLPDVIAARLASEPGSVSWERYFTTMSAEYVGLSRCGHPIVIVAHGIGPMATLDGVLASYRHQFDDKTRNRRGGRIPQSEFLKLESGGYGDVRVIDLASTWGRREYQFSGHAITAKEIVEESLWQARLGPRWREYIEHHSQFARTWEEKLGKRYPRPCIIAMDDAGNCSYSTREMFDHWIRATPDTAIAHLLSIGGLTHSRHQYHEHDYRRSENRESLACDVGCYEWWNGTRLLGIRAGARDRLDIHPGLPDFDELVETHLKKLWRPNPGGVDGTPRGFWHLVQIGDRFFTDYPKQGERMDNHEPEFRVTEIKEVSAGPRQFRTTIGGHHGFFKYGIGEVRRIAPRGANAYTVGEVSIEWRGGNPTHHVAPVTFYQVEVDTTRRLVRGEEIYRDFDLMMSLID